MKKYRVIFRKNLGKGTRIRVVIEVEGLDELLDIIEVKAKTNRIKPMRIQEMDGSKCINKYRIKDVDNDYDIININDRKIVELKKKVDNDTKEIDRSSEPWDEETCWWVVDSQCDLCHNPYGMDSRYPISICTECGHIQEEYNR